MKRDGPDHPKVRGLARKLEVPRYSVVGICELLWHWTAQYAHAGDIGRYTDVQIAEAVYWDGEPADLISAMVEVGLLDLSDEHRLIVHGWRKHCEDSVHMKLARKLGYFADGQPPKLARFGGVERTRIETHYRAHGAHTTDARQPHGAHTDTQKANFQPDNGRAHGAHMAHALPMPAPMPSQAKPSPCPSDSATATVSTEDPPTEPRGPTRMGSEAEGCPAGGMGRNERGLTDLLIANGVDEPEAQRLVKCATPQRIEQVVKHVQGQSDVRNPGGLIRRLVMDRSRDGELSKVGDLAHTIEVIRRNKHGGNEGRT